jgi:hypothetical protein
MKGEEGEEERREERKRGKIRRTDRLQEARNIFVLSFMLLTTGRRSYV